MSAEETTLGCLNTPTGREVCVCGCVGVRVCVSV